MSLRENGARARVDERSQSDGVSGAWLKPSKAKRGRTACSVDSSTRGTGGTQFLLEGAVQESVP